MLKENSGKSANQSISGNKNIVGSNINKGLSIGNVQGNSRIDARHYYSDSPDVLRAQIKEKDLLLAEKDERIREKDERIRELKEELKRALNTP
jgi:hypothetical protein